MRILIVDDSRNMRQIVANAIEGLGDIEIFQAGNGEEAEGILQEYRVLDMPIDLMILDWMMPKMSGFELLKKMRETEQFCEFPKIIMLTAETYAEQVSACLKYGVSQYVTKPFTADEIREAVLKVRHGTGGLKHAV